MTRLAAVPIVSKVTTRALRSRSYLSAITVIADNVDDILSGRRAEINQMTGRPELGRQPLLDSDVSRIRGEIERKIIVGSTKHGDPLGLQLSKDDVYSALLEVAHTNSYHPVGEYLTRLKWDGQPRIEELVGVAIKAERTPLNCLMVVRFFISAVARAMEPGCKVDTVLVVIGPQGLGKSTFFRVIAGEWFIDSPIDIAKKDALEQVRHAWIIEWAELESLFRARDATSVKAFLSSGEDAYRPSYGRNVIKVPRSCVFVGTTNHDEFLTDETGNRRFWPLRVSGIDIDQITEQRDQLWAEAVQLYKASKQWWLSPDEERLLIDAHDSHRQRDAWEDRVLQWADAQAAAFSTGDVLDKALEKPTGQWNRGDEMRISRILKAAGWFKKTDYAYKNGAKRWFR